MRSPARNQRPAKRWISCLAADRETPMLAANSASVHSRERVRACPDGRCLRPKPGDIHDFIEELPVDDGTMLGARGGTLSGGQRQGISIARAMDCNAPIVILDESMTGLSAESESATRKALRRPVATKTCLVITHDLPAAAEADRAYGLENGALREADAEMKAAWRRARRPVTSSGHRSAVFVG